jgi:zinc-binding alcohol dehydrogenase family protein
VKGDQMKAIGYSQNGPADVLRDVIIDKPVAGPRDLIVAVKAVSVNPVDALLRTNAPPEGDTPKVIGYDAAGVVESVGDEVSLFKVGDEVYYAGDISRPGTNAEFHSVDERLVGSKPKSLSFVEAAALPLTTITAWELLFDRFRVPYGIKNAGESLLIINGAGGVGSMLIQLARQLTGLTVIATASRPETIQWVEKLGAHHVINHHEPLEKAVAALGIDPVSYVAGLSGTAGRMLQIAELIAPQGALAVIDDGSLDIAPLKPKSITVSWEMIFTRSLFKTKDMDAQHKLLNKVSALIDAKLLQTTLTEEAGSINAENLKAVHKKIESGKAIGKIVLRGF